MESNATATREERLRATALGAVIEERGIKKVWLARQVGISDGHLANVIKGARTMPRSTAEQVARCLGLPLFLLFDASTDAIFPSTLDPLAAAQEAVAERAVEDIRETERDLAASAAD